MIRAAASERLFLAVWPPPEIAEQLAGLTRPGWVGVRWTSESQWHVTLRFFGSVPGSEDPRFAISRSLADLGGVQRKTTSCQAVMPRAVPELPAGLPAACIEWRAEVLGSHVLALPVTGLDKLAGAVRLATASIGMAETRPFRGHLTLARSKRPLGRGVSVASLASYSSELARMEGGEWTVEQVALVRSTLHPQGAEYETVATYPLGPVATSPSFPIRRGADR